MSTYPELLGVPVWEAQQDEPHISVNTAVALVLILNGVGVAKGTETPPGSPGEGDFHILGATPTGVWTGMAANNIAAYINGAWLEINAVDLLRVWIDSGSGQAAGWQYDAGAGPAAWVLTSTSLPATVIHSDATAVLTVGYSHTVHDEGTVSSGTFTPDEADGAMQKYVNGGAHTLAPPSNSTSLLIQMTNNGSAGALTTTGFNAVTGDTLTTTDGDDFFLTVTKNGAFSTLHVAALQ